MSDIIACPHCGGRSELKTTWLCRNYVSCRLCEARGPSYRFRFGDNDSYRLAEKRAVRAWNRRVGRRYSSD